MNKTVIWPVLFLFLILTTTLSLLLTKALLGDLFTFLPYSNEVWGGKYLILSQNNNELRPSGGFVSAYGILDIEKDGFNLNFADSYSLPYTADLSLAPQPFNILLDDPGFKGWYFRDANFDVDFSDAAEDLEGLYCQQSRREECYFDGIIAFNFEFLEDLVGIYGLEFENLELNRENLFSRLEYEVKNIDTHNVDALESRKNILGSLAGELLNKALFSFSKYDDFFEAVNIGLDQKKILLFFKNEQLQQIAKNNGWAGTFKAENYRNFIHTNIANIGGRKSDRYVKKNHEYFVSFDENGRGTVRYTLTLEHFGGYTLNSGVYKAYIRIFTPQAAGGYSENYLTVNPSEKKEIVIEYPLPEWVTQDNFELDLIKQPGTKDPWGLIVQFYGDSSFRADGFDIRDNVGFWSGYLLEDRHFDFEYVEDNIPPLVVWQKFSDLNLIEINFSEPLNDAVFLNPDNYEIVDMNYIDDETDSINVENVYFENGNVYLETEGISRADEERYSLILKNLEDGSGNTTIPSILEVTLVQSK